MFQHVIPCHPLTWCRAWADLAEADNEEPTPWPNDQSPRSDEHDLMGDLKEDKVSKLTKPYKSPCNWVLFNMDN